jgi:hypothetical protein
MGAENVKLFLREPLVRRSFSPLIYSTDATSLFGLPYAGCTQIGFKALLVKMQVKKPLWVKEEKGHPTLMLYSVVDDCSGVAYCEYHCVYGEDAETALRFLFNAMSPSRVG